MKDTDLENHPLYAAETPPEGKAEILSEYLNRFSWFENLRWNKLYWVWRAWLRLEIHANRHQRAWLLARSAFWLTVFASQVVLLYRLITQCS